MAQSGKWKGYYSQDGELHSFSIELEFDSEKIEGKGKDDIGKFKIEGVGVVGGEVSFTKQYEEKHAVEYKGVILPDGTSMHGTYNVFGAEGSFIMAAKK